MRRAYVEMEDGRVIDTAVENFTIEHDSGGCWPTVTMTGFLIGQSKREPQAPELMITDVIYNDPATVIYWSDKTRTVVKCQPGDTYDPKTGFLLALCKKVCGNTGNYNDLLRECIPGYGKEEHHE